MRDSSGSRALATFAAVLAVVGSAVATAAPASAALTAELQDLFLPATPYSHQAQSVSGRVVLTAADTSVPMLDPETGLPAESDGWRVTEQVSDLRYSGLHHGTAIPARNFFVISAETPVAADGASEAVDPVGGPKIPEPSPFGSLDMPRTVLEARPGYGRGTYTQGMVLSLTLPPGTRAGKYTGTITTTISPGLEATATPAPEPTANAASEPTTRSEPEPAASSEFPPTASPEPEPTVSLSPEPTVSTDAAP